MSKKIRKIMCISLLVSVLVIGSGIGALQTFATTNWDAIYKEAYDSVLLVKNSQSQEDINKARVSMRKMTPAWMKGFVGEFSKQVDKVQQKIFVSFYSILYSDGNPKRPKDMLTQWDIDEARVFIEGFKGDISNLPYVSSWSSAVDDYQRKHIKQAVDAVELTKGTRKLEDAYKAYWKVDSLMNVMNNVTVSNFAKDLRTTLHEVIGQISKDTLEAIKYMEHLDTLDVESLSSSEISILKQQLQQMKILSNKLDETMKNNLLDRISFCEENLQ